MNALVTDEHNHPNFQGRGGGRPVAVVKPRFNPECFSIPQPVASDLRRDKKQEVSTACRPQRRSPKKKKKSTPGAAAEEISLDVAVASLLSEADDIFTSQQQQRRLPKDLSRRKRSRVCTPD